MNRILDFKELVPKSVKNALNQIGERKIVSARCGHTSSGNYSRSAKNGR